MASEIFHLRTQARTSRNASDSLHIWWFWTHFWFSQVQKFVTTATFSQPLAISHSVVTQSLKSVLWLSSARWIERGQDFFPICVPLFHSANCFLGFAEAFSFMQNQWLTLDITFNTFRIYEIHMTYDCFLKCCLSIGEQIPKKWSNEWWNFPQLYDINFRKINGIADNHLKWDKQESDNYCILSYMKFRFWKLWRYICVQWIYGM